MSDRIYNQPGTSHPAWAVVVVTNRWDWVLDFYRDRSAAEVFLASPEADEVRADGVALQLAVVGSVGVDFRIPPGEVAA